MKVQLWIGFNARNDFLDHLVYLDDKGKPVKIEYFQDYSDASWRELDLTYTTNAQRYYELRESPKMAVFWEWEI